jgi:hypothetical protein
MTLEKKDQPSRKCGRNAADVLADLTGEGRENFVSDCEVPDFENQELLIKKDPEE